MSYQLKKLIAAAGCLIYLIYSSSAYAYLDPGSGSILFQSILMILLAIGAGWTNLKLFISRQLKKITNMKSSDRTEIVPNDQREARKKQS